MEVETAPVYVGVQEWRGGGGGGGGLCEGCDVCSFTVLMEGRCTCDVGVYWWGCL